MYKNKKILAMIPARGGSKGIKNKNIYPVCGKPLIAYTIEAALQAACFSEVIVSTDSEEIAQVAKSYGASVPFMRPDNLANDTAKGEPVATHAVNCLCDLGQSFDLLVYLQPTSPLRTSDDICSCLDFFIDNNLSSLTTVSEVVEHPLFMRTMGDDGKLTPVLTQRSDIRRQDLLPYYILNGAIYINTIDDVKAGWLGNGNAYGYLLPYPNGLDINTMKDIELAEEILATAK